MYSKASSGVSGRSSEFVPCAAIMASSPLASNSMVTGSQKNRWITFIVPSSSSSTVYGFCSSAGAVMRRPNGISGASCSAAIAPAAAAALHGSVARLPIASLPPRDLGLRTSTSETSDSPESRGLAGALSRLRGLRFPRGLKFPRGLVITVSTSCPSLTERPVPRRLPSCSFCTPSSCSGVMRSLKLPAPLLSGGEALAGVSAAGRLIFKILRLAPGFDTGGEAVLLLASSSAGACSDTVLSANPAASLALLRRSSASAAAELSSARRAACSEAQFHESGTAPASAAPRSGCDELCTASPGVVLANSTGDGESPAAIGVKKS
mmetsp:Transcript_6605/g.14373  ORF Transcript_6605/g.14373 Transcript_6605/m.14373 type:complete len:322 (-) Transcript_6605:521-1486(-)